MSEQDVKNQSSTTAEDTYEETVEEEQMTNEASESTGETEEEETSETSESSESSELSEHEQELAALKQALEEQKDRNLRLQAEFDNFRRRTRQEKEEFAKYASSKLIEQLLPVLDNFERAMDSSNSSQDFESLKKGIEMVMRQMKQVMEEEGLQEIEAVGQPFNPEFHQAVMQVESDEHEEGMIVEELQKGYKLKEKVLRPSMVKVSGGN